MWTIIHHPEVAEWYATLDDTATALVNEAVARLEQDGPGLGRPYADTIKSSRHHNMKELRTRTVRILFAFDPHREAILLVAGDKRGAWNRWYKKAVPLADDRYDEWLDATRGDTR